MITTLTKKISNLGEDTINLISGFGRAWIFICKILIKSVTPPFRFSLLLKQLYIVGAQSMAVVALVGGFTGAVLAVQANYTLNQFGATAFTGSMVALSLIRELGPVLTALMVNGRAGSAMTAELGIMKITEQVDAIKSMAVDPIRYLMVPRVLAGIISLPLLTALFDVVGIAGGFLASTLTLNLASGTFYSHMVQSVSSIDISSGLVKAIVFGLSISWVACYKGWTCSFGAVGVNKATTSSVVTSSVIILVLDYFLTSILTVVFL